MKLYYYTEWMNKILVTILILVVVLAGGWTAYTYLYTSEGRFGSKNPNLSYPEFKEVTEYYTETGGFKCSKPIKAKHHRVRYTLWRPNPQWEDVYLPVDASEAATYCIQSSAL